MREPVHTDFMDRDMQRLWGQLGPLPGDLRLYGGTALALYLNHRESTDFDLATPAAVIDLDFVGRIPAFKGARLNGGFGMVDAIVSGDQRDIKVTFMECGPLIPAPTRRPLAAPNGLAIAHPVDLTASKLVACMSRDTIRDYRDLDAAVAAWPNTVEQAIEVVTKRRLARETDIARALSEPSPTVAAELPKESVGRLRRFARHVLDRNSRRLAP